MIVVEVYSKPECHLCEEMKLALEKARREFTFELREILLEEGSPRYEEFKERVPVVFINGTFAFQYTFPPKAFARMMRSVG